MRKRMKKILLAEDEALIAMSMQLQLEEAGYNVYETVATGEEAVSCVKKNPPDIVLMDIHLSGQVDGIEAARQISDAFDIPIIFITGYPDNETKQEASQVNPGGYLTKPVGIEAITSTIAQIR